MNLSRPNHKLLISFTLTAAVIFVVSALSLHSQETPEPLTPPPGNVRFLSTDGPISFPFEIFNGDIRYRCEVNGRSVYMLLDDGFMWDQLLFWGGPGVDSLNLNYDGEIDIGGGTDDADKIASKTASNITVTFPGVEFTDQTAIVTSSASGVSRMWWGSEGQISAMLFKHFVVDINFDKMMITLIKRDNFSYTGRGMAVPWEPMGFGPWCIPATLRLADGRQVSLKLLMDLGYNDQLQLRTKDEHNIAVPDKALPTGLGRNIQNVETLGFFGRLPVLTIGDYEVKDLLVAYVSEQHSKNTISEAMIGLELLSRFNLTFDYDRQKLFIEPTRKFNEPWEYNMSGMSLRRGDGPYLEIVRIYPDSPASEAGLQAGDRVTQLNDRPSTDYTRTELKALLTQKGRTVQVGAERDDQRMVLSLLLRRLI